MEPQRQNQKKEGTKKGEIKRRERERARRR